MSNLLSRIIKISVYLLVFLLPLFFLPFSFEFFEFNKHYLLCFLVSIAFFAWLAKMVLIEKEIRFRRSPLDIPVLAFLLVAVLSAIFSVDKNSSLFGFYGRFSDGLMTLLSLGALYFLITNNVEPQMAADELPITADKKANKKSAKISHKSATISGMLKAFIWSVFFVISISYLSVFGVLEKLNVLFGGKLPQFLLSRIFNPVTGSLEGLAVFLAVILVMSASWLVVGMERRLIKFLTWILFFASFFLMVVISFKAAWVVVFTASLIFVGFSLWKRVFREDVNRLLLPIFLIVAAGIFMFTNSAGPIQTLSPDLLPVLPQEQVLSPSQSLIIGAKAMIENIKSVFLGSGIGTWHYDFAKFKSADFNQNILWSIRLDRPGSHITEVLGTMGLLGIAAYLFLIGAFLMLSYLVLEKNRQGIPCLMLFLAVLVSQIFFYQNTILAFTFWLALAVSVVGWQKPIVEKTLSFKDFPELSLVFSVILTILSLSLLTGYFFGVRFYLADVNYKNAIQTGQIQSLEKAVLLNPYQPQYKIVLSRAYFGEVLSELQKPLEERNQAVLTTDVYLAITYTKGGPVGTRNIKGAIEIAPNRVAAWETLGIIYRDIQGVAAGSLEWATKSFEKAIALEPTNPILHTELGKLYVTANKTDEAKKEFEKAKALKPDYIDSSIQLAFIYERENNPAEAIKQMETLASSYPLNVEVLFQLGRFYYNNKRVDDAISQFEKVIALMPNHSNAHYSLGIIYQSRGEDEKAIAEFEKVLELNPGNQDVQARLNTLRQPEK